MKNRTALTRAEITNARRTRQGIVFAAIMTTVGIGMCVFIVLWALSLPQVQPVHFVR